MNLFRQTSRQSSRNFSQQTLSEWPVIPSVYTLGKTFSPIVCMKKTLFVSNLHLLKSNGSVLAALPHYFGLQKGFLLPKIYSTSATTATKIREKLPLYEIQDNHHHLPCLDFNEHYAIRTSDFTDSIIHHVANNATRYNAVMIHSDGNTLGDRRNIEKLRQGLPIAMRDRIVVIEHTRRGTFQFNGAGPSTPVINMAQCWAKTQCESPLIAKAVVRKLCKLLNINIVNGDNRVYGIIGMGAIGQAVAEKLRSVNRRVVVYDADHSLEILSEYNHTASPVELLQRADFILGCSGKNCLADIAPEDIKATWDSKSRTYASCTSMDDEFKVIKQLLAKANFKALAADPLTDMTLQAGTSTVTLMRAGFPLNFDGGEESMTVEESAGTRCQEMAAFIQAQIMLDTNKLTPGLFMLDPVLQYNVVVEISRDESFGRHLPPWVSDYLTSNIEKLAAEIAQESRGETILLPEIEAQLKSIRQPSARSI